MVFGFNMFLTTIAFSTLVFYSLTKVPNDVAPKGDRPDLTAVIKDKFRGIISCDCTSSRSSLCHALDISI